MAHEINTLQNPTHDETLPELASEQLDRILAAAGFALDEDQHFKRYKNAGHESFHTFCRKALRQPLNRIYLLRAAAQATRELLRHTEGGKPYVPLREQEAHILPRRA